MLIETEFGDDVAEQNARPRDILNSPAGDALEVLGH